MKKITASFLGVEHRKLIAPSGVLRAPIRDQPRSLFQVPTVGRQVAVLMRGALTSLLIALSCTGLTVAAQTYSVTYDGNGHVGGRVPVDSNSYSSGALVSVLDNVGDLVLDEMNFDGWSTAIDGGGVDYAAGDTFEIGGSNVMLYAQWKHQVDVFDDRDAQIWNTENGYTYRVYVPQKDGSYPVFLFTQGAGGSIWVEYIAEMLTAMAERGFVAIAIDYGQSLASTETGMLAMAKGVYDEADTNSAINVIIAAAADYNGARADTDRGIVVSGFSLGAGMAALSANFNSDIRAALLMGNGTSFNPNILLIENIAFSPNQIRSLAGENDQYFGSTPDGVRKQQEATTGWDDPTDSMLDFIQPEGCGWSIAPGTHEFFGNYSGALYSSFKEGTNSWSMNPGLDWLAGHAGYLYTTNGSVPHVWLEAQNPAWTNDYEVAVRSDPDGDGFSTLEEYWSGTDPQEGESCLKIDEITHDGTNVTLSWRNAQVDSNIPPLAIERSFDLRTDAWFNVGQKVPVEGTNVWSDSSSPTSAFFRIKATINL
jgi:dienelactone hydrolase